MPDVIYGVTWNGTEKVNYTYDSLGRLTNKNVNSVLNNNYSYIDVNSTKTTTLLSSLSTVAGTYSYTYDELGNITSINDGTYTTSYEYDDLNQLVRVNDQKAGVTYTYEYSNGNITSKKEYAYTTGDLGSLQDTITWNYADSTWGDLLTSFDGKSITYDAIGNPVTYGNYTINWNGRRLESINLNDTEVLSYSYNIDGQRVSKTYEGVTTQYFYNGDILAGEKTGNNVIIYMYDNNGDIFGFTYNGTEYYYIKNAQNDVVAIADASGNVVVRYYYNAWGEIIDCVDNTTFELSSINPITYRSYYNDNIVGMDMYYLNSRYYLADWGRFVSADSYVQTGQGVLSNNMFAYCMNNPVNYVDPYGNCPYNGTAADFHRLEQGLPSLDCTCGYSEPNKVIYSKGKVIHIYKTEDDANNVYQLTRNNVVRIVDSRSNNDSNIKILDSYKIDSVKEQTVILTALSDYNSQNPSTPSWNRTLDSMLLEWDIHNVAYNFGVSPISTAHVDLNNADEGKGWWDFIWERGIKPIFTS